MDTSNGNGKRETPPGDNAKSVTRSTRTVGLCTASVTSMLGSVPQVTNGCPREVKAG